MCCHVSQMNINSTNCSELVGLALCSTATVNSLTWLFALCAPYIDITLQPVYNYCSRSGQAKMEVRVHEVRWVLSLVESVNVLNDCCKSLSRPLADVTNTADECQQLTTRVLLSHISATALANGHYHHHQCHLKDQLVCFSALTLLVCSYDL